MRDLWLRISGLILVAVVACLFLLTIQQSFIPFEYADFPIDDSLAQTEEEISRATSQAVWDKRSLDTIILAFLLVIASVCCATILDAGKELKK
jgi:choline-glycine betaine transporter